MHIELDGMQDGRKGVASGKSSATSSATGSPMARDNATPEDAQGKPRMNARQRRTLRRRREREISSVADHVAELGGSLDSNEKSAFDLQMEEVTLSACFMLASSALLLNSCPQRFPNVY